jgi:hypothetical protein
MWRNNPSAIGLRQTFPVQTNKIFLSGLKARKPAMFDEAVQGHVGGRNVSAYRRIGVSAYRRIGVSAYRRVGVRAIRRLDPLGALFESAVISQRFCMKDTPTRRHVPP